MNRKLLVMVAALFVYGAAQAQDFKIGYTYIDFIVYNMPEMVGIRSELKTFEDQLASQAQAKRATLQTKVNELQQMAQQPNASQAALQAKDAEVRKMDQDFQTWTAQAQQSLAAKESNLMNPVFSKVQTAIDEVRKELGYQIILNMRTSSNDGIVLAAEEDLNITEKVFEKLGVPMPTTPSPSDPATANSGNGN
ncbi:OmpH family outer membrane protein [Roseivirga sp. E12]|uniref:OmpH family outer membrane protein n=1 Tax=Roseivirga sp. E12 TaxID=2819237 RepID=UPI001ABD3C27|nr:OmpH family outer membrane protein [Roseivirga sp. E12]MBO3698950.1 OmpH family outer membrane protein [Roseivirga sp. E12]